MARQLIGQVLSRMGKLNPIDIDEILVEQGVTHRRFGEIALSWGLCNPEHIGEAWCRQLAEEGGKVDLARIGMDACAASCLPAELALRLRAIPIRILGDLVVVAVSRPLDSVQIAELSRALGRPIRLVVADPAQIDQALEACYSSQAAA